jgi:hypothetical protein
MSTSTTAMSATATGSGEQLAGKEHCGYDQARQGFKAVVQAKRSLGDGHGDRDSATLRK